MITPVFRFVADACSGSGAHVNGQDYCTGLPTAAASSDNLQHILQVFIGTLAVVAVLIIVIAGLNFVTASGDPQKVAKARSAIIYALVGLIVATSAEVIVTFVLGNIG